MAPLKVLIVGGGVAGPALAHWLSRIGANITLIERFPRMRATGQQVDLRGQGVPMMHRMGIEAAVRAKTVKEKGTQLIDTAGRCRAFFAAAEGGTGKQSFTSEYEIMRGDLVGILNALTEGRANVRHLFDTTIDSFTQDEESDPDGKVHVSFRDGSKEDYDLVVGADGTGSKTRRVMLGPDAPDPRHRMGGYIGYYSIPSKPHDSDRGTFCHLPGPFHRAIGTRKDCPELTRVYMLMNAKGAPAAIIDAAYKSGNLTELKKAWADLYQCDYWECDRFVDALRHAPEADDFYCTPYEEVRLPEGSWSKGRVVLVGDAAHSGTADGYGCTWGLVGPYLLAGEIAARLHGKEALSPTEAVMRGAKKYEEIFRPIATASQGGNKWFDMLSTPSSRLGIWSLHAVARLAARLRLDQMAGLGEEQAKWELPTYPELEEAQS
ncbi:Uu.00g060310.m01.CDS01 [Anthostomella pinea]|uniref:Uu.00g060310.m01.CDS01 n=1 Tax=Anthostomella pinea TaxID=933095 RepID=A0AAI8VSA1_9PEZI|nr:Uu.00g060310.m01.CDS01 [Anthostomella pinea]